MLFRLQEMTALLSPQDIIVVWQLQEMIEEMCKHVEKPLVFPLSNPTSQAEITAENAYKYSKGKCIFAGGKHADIQLVTLPVPHPLHMHSSKGQVLF